jgi:hypothetical protein
MKKITQTEFIKQFCENSDITEKELNELGKFAFPCDCDEEVCQGWEMLSLENFLLRNPE